MFLYFLITLSVSVLTVVEYLMVSLPVPLVLLLLVGGAAGEQHLVAVVALRAGRVLLKLFNSEIFFKTNINFYVDIILKWSVM